MDRLCPFIVINAASTGFLSINVWNIWKCHSNNQNIPKVFITKKHLKTLLRPTVTVWCHVYYLVCVNCRSKDQIDSKIEMRSLDNGFLFGWINYSSLECDKWLEIQFSFSQCGYVSNVKWMTSLTFNSQLLRFCLLN